MILSVEQRRMERFSLELPAQLQIMDGKVTSNSPVHLCSFNISASGGFFVTDSLLPIGTEVEIYLLMSLDKLQNSSGKKVWIHVSGLVVRSGGNGMAISFDEHYQILPLPQMVN